jgi:arylsulfatase A-like enzyme
LKPIASSVGSANFHEPRAPDVFRIAFTTLAFLVLLAATSVQAETRPNIVYILLDDAGYGDLSCYGQEKFSTPHMDKLAEQGMRFTQHYAGSTVCAPTRCVLMTGLTTGHCVVRGNTEVQPEGQAPMPAATVTLPKLLKTTGYATGGFGKWGLGAPGSEGDPVHQGFDRFFGYNCQRQAHKYYPTHLWDNLNRVELDGKTYSHDLIMAEAFKFVRQHRDEPFFLFLPVAIPHAAMEVPEPYMTEFREKFPQFENKIGRYAGTEVRNPIAAFAGMMTKLDNDIGLLMALLEELKIADSTIVMLSSDNGPHKEGGHDPDFFNSNGGFRGYKRDLYEGGIRAPFIVRWPGKVEAGTTTDLVSAHWDVLPTICEIAGVKTPKESDGVSLVPTLTGHADQQKTHDYLYWEFYEQNGRRAARFGDWKAVQYGLHQSANAPIEIYNLANDPHEDHNLASEHPELVTQAKEIFAEAHTPSDQWSFRGK